MSAIIDALLERVKLPIPSASLEKTSRGVRLRVPIDVVLDKLKEELERALRDGRSPLPPEAIDVTSDEKSIIFEIRVV